MYFAWSISVIVLSHEQFVEEFNQPICSDCYSKSAQYRLHKRNSLKHKRVLKAKKVVTLYIIKFCPPPVQLNSLPDCCNWSRRSFSKSRICCCCISIKSAHFGSRNSSNFSWRSRIP